MAEKKELKFEIKKEIAVLSTRKGGWNREMNIVSWNGAAPKIDIRDWSPDHSKMGKGLALTSEELAVLKSVLEDFDPYAAEEY